MRKLQKSIATLVFIISTSFVLNACASEANQAHSPEEQSSGSLESVTQVLNWTAEAEVGGNYAALHKGYYQEVGLDMTIIPGGPKVSPIQIVAAGKAKFGIAQAEDVLIAREEGIPLVAVAALFQESPGAMLFHKGAKIKEFTDLNNKVVYTVPGLAVWEFIKKKYNLTVQERSYDPAQFAANPESVLSAFITNQPYSMEQQGIETDYLMLADSGFDTFGNVIITMEDTVKKEPDLVKAYVQATIKGWKYYENQGNEINQYMYSISQDMTLDSLHYAHEKQKPLVYGGDAKTQGYGYMSEERWENLREQLAGIGMSKTDEPINNVFTNVFLTN